MLRDWKFRQALNWAVDREKIVDLVWGGHQPLRARTIVPPNYYHDPDWHWEPPADVKYTFDPEIAKQKLDEAGYPDSDGDGMREYKGEPIELGLIARDGVGARARRPGKLIVGWFKDVGVKVKLEVMDEATLGDRELNYEGDDVHPRLRHVPVGLVPRLRPRLDAELPHQGPDRELERDLLVGS